MPRPSEEEERTPHVLTGTRLYLRPLTREDLAHIRRWSEDAELRTLIGELGPMSEAESEEYLYQVDAYSNREWFAVIANDDNRIIGEAGFRQHSHEYRCRSWQGNHYV